VAAARSAGIPAADIESTAPNVHSTSIAGAELDMLRRLGPAANGSAADEAASAAEPAMAGATGTLRIELRDLSRLERLQRALEQVGGGQIPAPSYSLSDDRAARRTARNQALATVRADAEAYAASLGMRVVRIVRVTERGGADFMSLMLGEAPHLQNLFERRERRDRRVATYAIVGVDFALAPQ
jgi:hypothetical protein